jgi:uncharacterized protein (DUF1778 family)
MSATLENETRVDLRLSSQAKATLEEAAALTGQSLSDFAVSTLLERANQVLETNRRRTLTEQDALIFLKALDADEPNPALREAAAWYKENYGHSVRQLGV